MLFGGIDLAAKPKNYSGVCVSNGRIANVKLVRKDEEIIDFVRKCKIVAIDAPLFLPKGLKTIFKGMPQRKCDIELRNKGIKYFPLAMKSMKALTYRGMILKKRLEKMGIKVIETYPGGVYDLSGINRKDKKRILNYLSKHFRIEKRKHTKDEIDAITCAYVSYSFYKGTSISLGEKSEGLMILARL